MAATRLRIGNVEILDLDEGVGPMLLAQVFAGVSAEEWTEHFERHPDAFHDRATMKAHFGCYLVRSGGRTILVDTGVGPAPAPEIFGDLKGRLPQELAANGVDPESIDVVFITHVHPDHVGWNLTESGEPRFPRARYLIHEKDWETLPAFRNAMPPYIDQTLTPLQTLGRLDLLAGETPITDEIVAMPAPGHTPGHMVLLVSSAGEKGIILGDALVHPAHVGNPHWAFGFDYDPETAIATRRLLLDRIEAEGMTMVQCHLPAPGYGRIVRVEGRRWWQAL